MPLNSEHAILNYEGGSAYSRDPRRALAQAAACCLLNERSFYEKSMGGIIGLVREVGRTHPRWLVKLAVFLREELHLRSVVHLIAAHCLTLPEARSSIQRAFLRIAPRADDSLEIARLLKDDCYQLGSALPHAARRLLARRLNQLTEYEVIKYGRRPGFALKHLLSLVHPKPASRKQSILFRYLLAGKKRRMMINMLDPALTPQLLGYELFKGTNRRHTRKICGLIEKGLLPWEVAIPAAGSKKAVWSACVKAMPVMALVRNLRNLKRSGALSDPKIRQIVLDKLADPEAIRNSKLLPFRWLSAYRTLAEDDPEIGAVLNSALEISLVHLPRFAGTTFISCDNSGSMYLTPLSARSVLVPADISNLMGAMIFHLSEHGFVSVFAENFARVRLSREDTTLSNWEKIRSTQVGMATYAFKAIQHLLKEEINVDRIIIPTDMIIYSPAESDGESGAFLNLLRLYRRRINPRVKTYIINLQPYTHFIAPEDEEGVTTISGWSESILKYIEHVSAPEGCDMADIVERIRL